jgi:hypothetical protein
MSEFVFTSPGVKFREKDLSFVTRTIGITTLGTVGETPKGPAFEPVYVQDTGELTRRFGQLNNEKYANGQLRYQLPYVANSYLAESNQMWLTRVLGLSGYDAGEGWALTLSAGVDPSTTGLTTNITTGTDNFSGNTYLGVSLFASGDTGSYFSGFQKVSGSFTGDYTEFTATTVNPDGSGVVSLQTTVVSGESYSEYENMVLAIIRSRGDVEDVENGVPVVDFDAEDLAIIENNTIQSTGDLFGLFKLRATKPSDSSDIPEDSVVSLNPNAREFITNVLGNKPKGKNNKLYVEAVYPDLIKKLDGDGLGYGVNTDLIELKSGTFTDYKDQFQTPETPWVVSELRGSDISRLFRFISISDGAAANKEIKVTIQNVNPTTKEFDVLIRDFNDSDENVSVLESYTRCTLRKSETNFLGSRIGTTDGEYDINSEYVMLEMADDAPEDAFPAGFEGYFFNDFAASATSTTNAVNGVAPLLLYKTQYNADERLNRVYLGISETAYDSNDSVGTGINQNYFNYIGKNTNYKTKGFHMDSGATEVYYDGRSLIGEFETGAGKFRTSDDINSSADVYFEEDSRKFTFVPAGGFDGWDEHRTERTNGDLYRKGGIFDGVDDGLTPKNDFQAWETAIATFSNPEEVTINLFTTPGINWSDHNVLVKNTIEMVEKERTDSLYIIDSPDIDIDTEVGGDKVDVRVAKEMADLLDIANIDSSYSATYFSYIQKRDDINNVNVWLPPTGEVVKSMAYTDNVKFPWFAPAGLQRGVIDARKSKYKLSQSARDIIYKGRINPIVDHIDVGTAIFGQKTLQVRESALDRINVRRLLLQIKVLISNIAVRILFEQNDQTTIDEFLGKANPVLDTIKRERGLEDFRIKMDDSNNTPESRDRNELYGEIYLKPTKAVEYIGINFTITPSGASFENI